MSRLIILVSNDFRVAVEKIPLATREFDLGKSKLLVHSGDEKPWLGLTGLRKDLLELLKTHRAHSVRIVAHLSSCFKNECDQKMFQVRVVEQEAEMRAESHINDLEIWGFRHDTAYSKLWNVFSEILAAIKKGKLNGEAAEQLDAKLDQAFSEATTQDAYEHVTLTRHQILGLFVSVRLSIEVAAEKKDAGVASLERVRGGLRTKKSEALRMLDEGMAQLDQLHHGMSSKLEAERFAVAEALNDMPELDVPPKEASLDFNAWLSKLDDSLDKLRRRCR